SSDRAGFFVFDARRDMVAIAHDAMEFFAHESCGKCFPCRIGTQRITERLAVSATAAEGAGAPGGGRIGPEEFADWQQEIVDLSRGMKATSACGLGLAAPLVAESLMRDFPEAVARHVAT